MPRILLKNWNNDSFKNLNKKHVDDENLTTLLMEKENIIKFKKKGFYDSNKSKDTVTTSYNLSNEILKNLGPRTVFDSHCHLDFILFWRTKRNKKENFASFLEDFPLMKHPSLDGFITNFCSPKLWSQHLSGYSPLVKSLLDLWHVFYTIGCHPHYATEMTANRIREMENLLLNAGPRCVAIGECGLDTSKKNSVSMADQIEVFKIQLKIAMKLKKPLVLHIRGAELEAIKVLEEVGLPSDWPIHRHCWNDTWSACKNWLQRFPGSVVGLTPLITFSHSEELRSVVRDLPLDKVLLETDAPYFLPRGGGRDGLLGHNSKQFSVPIHAANVAAQIAVIKGCDINDVLKANRENIRRIYRI